MSDRDDKGRFKAGNKGRPKGAKNKRSFDEHVYSILSDIHNEVFTKEKVIEDLGKVSPENRLAFYQNTLEYKIPKLNRTELEHDLSGLEIPLSPWDNPVTVEEMEQTEKE